MNIFKNDFVIEIGSGDNPKIRSDVLCDKFIDDNTQRAGDVVKDRPIVEADIEYLPFPDKCFDYAICSHVLEHAESPERMFKELMRISHRGYIEAPSEIAERLFGWPFHKWFINLLDNRLVLTRKNSEDSFGLFFHYLLAHDKYFLRLYERYRNCFLVRYEWKEKIDFQICNSRYGPDLKSMQAIKSMVERKIREPLFDFLKESIKKVIPIKIKSRVKSIIAKNRKQATVDLCQIIVCPICKGNVRWSKAEITCQSCHRVYPIRGGIPRLLVD